MRNQRIRILLTSPWVICAVALAVRLIALGIDAGGYLGRPSYPIGTEIGRIAQSIATGNGFASPFIEPTGPTAWVAPVYPNVLAGAYRVFGMHTFASLMAILIFNCICSALTVLPLHGIARAGFSGAGPSRLVAGGTASLRATENGGVAAWAAWLWALLPSLVNFPVRWVWETSLSALLLTTMVWVTLKIIQDSKFKIQDEDNADTAKRARQASPLRAWIGLGVVAGVAGLTNPALLAPVPFLLLWAAMRLRRAKGEWAKPLLLATAACALVIAPWLARNYSVFGQFVFIRSNAGVELWLGNNPQVEDSWTFWLHPSESKEELAKFRALGEPEYAAEKQREALQFIAAHPGKFAMLTLNRFVYFWMGTWDSLADLWTGARLWPAVNATLYAALALLAMAGLAAAMRTGAPAAIAMGIVMLCYPVVYYVTHPILRFRHPVDAVLVILAVVAMGRAIQRLRKRTPDAPGPIPADGTI